jgi:hypothetical protein
MANKNTWRKRARKENGYHKKTGRCLDTSKLRAEKGKKPANLPATR